jgi:hypothetical protein
MWLSQGTLYIFGKTDTWGYAPLSPAKKKTLLAVTVTLFVENLKNCFSTKLFNYVLTSKSFSSWSCAYEVIDIFFIIMSVLAHFRVRWPEQQDYLAWFGLSYFSCSFSKHIFNLPFHTGHCYQKRKSNTMTVHMQKSHFPNNRAL